MGMVVIQPYILVKKLKKTKTKFLRCTGYINSIKKPLKQDLLLIIVLVRQQNFLSYYPHVLQLLKNMLLSTVTKNTKNLFWSIKNSGEVLDKLEASDFNATSLSTYEFSTLYTTLPNNLLKDKLIDLIERTFNI